MIQDFIDELIRLLCFLEVFWKKARKLFWCKLYEEAFEEGACEECDHTPEECPKKVRE